MEVIRLLHSYNNCLRNILHLGAEFLSLPPSAEISARLHIYEKKRRNLFKTLELGDKKIGEICQTLPIEKRTSALIEGIKAEMQVRDSLVADIIKQDDQITVEIEKERLRLLQEVARSEKSKGLLNKFKSSWISESGERLDGRV